jgi:hypothetical protein
MFLESVPNGPTPTTFRLCTPGFENSNQINEASRRADGTGYPAAVVLPIQVLIVDNKFQGFSNNATGQLAYYPYDSVIE